MEQLQALLPMRLVLVDTLARLTASVVKEGGETMYVEEGVIHQVGEKNVDR